MKWVRTFSWLMDHKDDLSYIVGSELGIITSDSSFIYGIRNIVTDKWYIGRTVSLWQRLYQGRGRNGHVELLLNNDSRSFITDPDQFEFIILEIYDKHEDTELLAEREKFFVQKYDSFHNGYNKTISGDLNEGSQTRGRKIFTNIVTGEVSYIESKDIESLDSNTYKPGRLNNVDKHWYHSPDNTKESYYFDGDQPSDWILGRLPGRGGDNTRGRWCISYLWKSCDYYNPMDLYLDVLNHPEAELRFCRPDEKDWYKYDEFKSLPVITLDEAKKLLNTHELELLNLIN